MNPLPDRIAAYWHRVQATLFPYLETTGLVLTPALKAFVACLDLLRIEEQVPTPITRLVGAPPKDRRPLARALLAKHAFNLPNNKALRERLMADGDLRAICGWPTATALPSESTFSRAFARFADLGLADEVLDQRVTELVGDTLVWHQALDATAIPAREAAGPNPPPQYGLTASGKRRKHPVSGRPRGGPRKGEVIVKPQTRMERQLTQVPEIALLEIPTACDRGCKKNVHGHLEHWVGYKFHVVTNEWGVPLCAVTTAASVNDSQVAIPLLQLTARRVTALYDLMDRGYDAAAIRACSAGLGHVPVIRPIARADDPEAGTLEPDRARLYKGRTVAERFNARLKDEVGVAQIRVHGHRKVHAHLMFGLLVIFADALLRMAG
jgi:hypothetical protein